MSLPFWIRMTWIWEGWNKASCPQRSEQNTPDGKACRAADDRGASIKPGQDEWKWCYSAQTWTHYFAHNKLNLKRMCWCWWRQIITLNVTITVVHINESSHLHERFGPDSGAHGQDNAGPSLQEANVTLQLPALHQRARLQEGGQAHT